MAVILLQVSNPHMCRLLKPWLNGARPLKPDDNQKKIAKLLVTIAGYCGVAPAA